MCFWSLTTARVYLGEPTYGAVLGCYSTWRPSQLKFRTIADTIWFEKVVACKIYVTVKVSVVKESNRTDRSRNFVPFSEEEDILTVEKWNRC